jgi:hypothetical protein
MLNKPIKLICPECQKEHTEPPEIYNEDKDHIYFETKCACGCHAFIIILNNENMRLIYELLQRKEE